MVCSPTVAKPVPLRFTYGSLGSCKNHQDLWRAFGAALSVDASGCHETAAAPSEGDPPRVVSEPAGETRLNLLRTSELEFFRHGDSLEERGRFADGFLILEGRDGVSDHACTGLNMEYAVL